MVVGYPDQRSSRVVKDPVRDRLITCRRRSLKTKNDGKTLLTTSCAKPRSTLFWVLWALRCLKSRSHCARRYHDQRLLYALTGYTNQWTTHARISQINRIPRIHLLRLPIKNLPFPFLNTVHFLPIYGLPTSNLASGAGS